MTNAVVGIDIQSVFSYFLILLLKKDLDLTLRTHLLFWKDKDTWFFQVQNNSKNLKLFAMEILGVGKVLGFNVQKNCKQTFYGIHWKNSFQWKKGKTEKSTQKQIWELRR